MPSHFVMTLWIIQGAGQWPGAWISPNSTPHTKEHVWGLNHYFLEERSRGRYCSFCFRSFWLPPFTKWLWRQRHGATWLVGAQLISVQQGSEQRLGSVFVWWQRPELTAFWEGPTCFFPIIGKLLLFFLTQNSTSAREETRTTCSSSSTQ